MISILTVLDHKRGCGWRKPGGMYLMSGGFAEPCGKLPIPLELCPCCGAGIKFSRSFQWVSNQLIMATPCSIAGCKGCNPFDGTVEKFGLIWIGEKFYKTPEDFRKEAEQYGISRRLNTFPRGFEIGKTWVLVAHIHAIPSVNEEGKLEHSKGIFQAFKPTRVEYVVKGTETEEELEDLAKRGLTLVKVEHANDGNLTPEIQYEDDSE